MQQGKFKIALFGNIYQERKSVAVQKFFALASELKAELLIPASFYAFLTDNLQISVPQCHIIDDAHGETFDADIVVMSSYAPMLAKDGHHNWNPDMIYFSNTEVRTTPAYEVQRLFSCYSGDRYLFSEISETSEISENSENSETSETSETSEYSEPSERSALSHRIGASVVKDSRTGKTYVKLVNALPVELQLDVRGLSLQGAKGEGFSGKPTDQKLQCQPVTLGEQISLPPYSFQVVEL